VSPALNGTERVESSGVTVTIVTETEAANSRQVASQAVSGMRGA